MDGRPDRRFQTHAAIWEDNAQCNPQWAILSDKGRMRWDPSEFRASGEADVDAIAGHLQRLNIDWKRTGRGLDFGSGLGRLTRPMLKLVPEVIGVDVSASMTEQARHLHADSSDLQFFHNPEQNLQVFPDNSFHLVLSYMVLQHIPPPHNLHFLSELIRVLEPGGIAILHIPSHRQSSWRNRLRTLVPEFLMRQKHNWLNSDQPYVTMFGIPEEQVSKLVSESSCSIVWREVDKRAGDDWHSYTYYIRK